MRKIFAALLSAISCFFGGKVVAHPKTVLSIEEIKKRDNLSQEEVDQILEGAKTGYSSS